MVRENMGEEVAQNSSARITATIEDETGAVVAASQLSTLTLTLYDEATDTIINSRSDQSVKNLNGGTVDELGAFVLQLAPLDNIIVTDSTLTEWHVCLLEWTWGTPTRQGRKEVGFRVKNMVLVP